MDKFRLGIQNRCRVKVRGIELVFRPLTIAESVEVTSASIDKFNKALPSEKHSINESHIIAIISLCKASELKSGTPGVTEDTLKMLTADELGYVFSEYNAMVQSCNPRLETLPDSECIALIEELKKKAHVLPTELSFTQALSLALYSLTKLP